LSNFKLKQTLSKYNHPYNFGSTKLDHVQILIPELGFLKFAFANINVSGTIIRGTLKAPNSQLVTPISIKLQRPDGCD
jgi:hypothetical protein